MTVARSLLTRVQSSALAAMFSGRHTLRANKDGAIFIDRDADSFSLLITYLRNNCKMPQIKEDYLREKFEIELDYWGIEDSNQDKLNQLQEVFAEPPNEIVMPKVTGMWKQIGPWDLVADVESSKIKLKQDLPIVRQELEPGYLYVGQTPTLTGVFVGRVQCHRGFEEGEFIHDSSLRSGICLNGYGRAYRSEKFYEG